MKTIAVMNQKGGTGKTTSAINLAGELVRRGKKVLIVDMDTQGNATSNLQLTEVPPYTLTDVIVSKTAVLADTICHTSIENLDLIRGGGLLAPALAAMQEMPFGRDTTLRRLLPQLPDHKLNTLCAYLGLELDHHRAGSDSLACGEVLLHHLLSGADMAAYTRTYDLENIRTARQSRCR